jgi:hypothetical protein
MEQIKIYDEERIIQVTIIYFQMPLHLQKTDGKTRFR